MADTSTIIPMAAAARSRPASATSGRASRGGRCKDGKTPHRDEVLVGEEGVLARDRSRSVEAAFFEGFLGASDTTSFLRLARVPFEGTADDGARLVLLRVEVDSVADIGIDHAPSRRRHLSATTHCQPAWSRTAALAPGLFRRANDAHP